MTPWPGAALDRDPGHRPEPLAPGPYASMLLADLGAEVIAVTGGRAGQVPADFARGKRFVHLNLKHPASRQRPAPAGRHR